METETSNEELGIKEFERNGEQTDEKEAEEDLATANSETLPGNKKGIPTKEELDAEYKKYEDNFAIFIKDYKFPDDISKNGKRKLIGKLRFEFFRPFKQLNRRVKMKRKKTEGDGHTVPSRKRYKTYSMKDSQSKLKIAVDCSYDDLMSDKDISKLSSQIQRCYSINRHKENPLQLHVTQMEGKLLSRMEKFMDGFTNWDIHFKNESLAELFKSENIVYLCAESENLLTDFDPDKVYAIGGFVDHNSHKGLSYQRAIAAGFGHARLPIDSFFTLSTRKVLTVCHVFEIISMFSVTKDWKSAIENAIPERKGLEALGNETSEPCDEALVELSNQDVPRNDNVLTEDGS